MIKILFLLFLLLPICFPGTAQSIPELDILIKERKKIELFNKLREAGEDTNKIKIQLELTNFHWSNGRNKDSVSRHAEEARKLSQKLHYNTGYYEASLLLCKNYLINNQPNKALDLLAGFPADQEARFRLLIGEYYLFQMGLEKRKLDSALLYFNESLSLAKSIKSEKWKHESLIALGKYYFSNDEFIKGKNSFLEIIQDLQKTGNRSAEAHIWSELGIYMPDTDSTMKDELWAHGNSMKIYHELKDTANEVSVMEDIAGINMYHANFALAKSQLLKAVELRKAAGIKKRYKVYISLALICHATGNLDEALFWALEAEKNVRQLEITNVMGVNMLLGMIYGDDGQPEKSLKYLLEIKAPDKTWNYFYVNKTVEQYISLNQPQKALTFIREWEKKFPAIRPVDRETVAAIKGDVYAALNNPSLAEKYYLQMIQMDIEAQKRKSREVITFMNNHSGSEAYYKIAKFYETQNKFDIAGRYADRALQIQSFTGNNFYTAHLMQKIWWLKFKVDSAAGNYVAAIQHFEKYTALKDSIFSATKSNQLQQTLVRYETDKKESDIKTRDQQIQSLTQTDILQQANLKQAHLIRNITIALLAILLVLGGLLYKQYRQKQKSSLVISETNKVISQKNLAITHKNEALEHLVAEKEWLLKEVHHRVKNNLHTVICLLESQATYLESDAREANEISQQRIYAMSLIHQKIYQSEDIKSIDMAVYLPELIQHLDDSFGNNRKIRFDVDIDRVTLDISQAIPIALIINEAVTNAIKYAFPGNRQGTIRISMYQLGDQITLMIADNGIGIDSAILDSPANSLGMQLIKGLSKDIKARLQFENSRGTRISIVFHLNPLNKPDYKIKAFSEDQLYV